MSLVNELIKGLLPEEEKKQTTAVYAGGFKPPTSGHFEVVQQALKKNPEIDEFIIFIGNKERNGISQSESLLIWEIYNNYLPFKVKIVPTSVPPIKAVYNFAKEHPTREVLWVIGAREGNEEDFKDITSRTKSISKYPNLELRTIVTAGGVSGTAARNAAKVSQEKFVKFLPGMLNPEERTEIYNIVADKIQEVLTKNNKTEDYTKKQNINENLPKVIIYKNNLDITSEYDSLVENIPPTQLPISSICLLDSYFSKKEYLNEISNNKIKSLKISVSNKKHIPPIVVREYKNKYQVLDGNHRYISYKELNKEHINAIVLPTNQVAEITSPQDLDLIFEKMFNKYPDFRKFNYNPYIASLTKHMLDNGMKLEPLPQIQMIHDDYENGEDLFGKTAYYNPGNNSVVLFTYGRHPKDILRSYAHELVHVHQNMEDRLTGLGANTDVNQDDHLEQIEREAYETGNIMFRSWTDSITGNKLTEELSINPNLPPIEMLQSKLKRLKGNFFGSTLNEGKKKDPFGLNESSQPTFTMYSGITGDAWEKIWKDKNFKDKVTNITSDEDFALDYSYNFKTGKYEDKYVKISNIPLDAFVSVRDRDYEDDDDFESIANLGDEEKINAIKYNDLFLVNLFPYKSQIKTTLIDDSLNEKKKPYKHKSGFNPKLGKDPFGLNAYARELAMGLEEQENQFKVYLDMDGVIADFDQRFRDLSGMEPRDFENKYGKKAFWNLIDEENKIKFWVGIPEMPGAKALVDYVKKYNFELLTSPSAKKQSYLGKILWVRNHIGSVFPSKPRINFKKAKEKHLVKPQLTKTDILIDDREDTIERWNAAGGTGIVYKNISQVLNDLGKLGL
jgi:hypothetical protein